MVYNVWRQRATALGAIKNKFLVIKIVEQVQTSDLTSEEIRARDLLGARRFVLELLCLAQCFHRFVDAHEDCRL